MLFNLLEVLLFLSPVLAVHLVISNKFDLNSLINPFTNKIFSSNQALSSKNKACLIPHYIY